jgi:hypothetical protein
MKKTFFLAVMLLSVSIVQAQEVEKKYVTQVYFWRNSHHEEMIKEWKKHPVLGTDTVATYVVRRYTEYVKKTTKSFTNQRNAGSYIEYEISPESGDLLKKDLAIIAKYMKAPSGASDDLLKNSYMVVYDFYDAMGSIHTGTDKGDYLSRRYIFAHIFKIDYTDTEETKIQYLISTRVYNDGTAAKDVAKLLSPKGRAKEKNRSGGLFIGASLLYPTRTDNSDLGGITAGFHWASNRSLWELSGSLGTFSNIAINGYYIPLSWGRLRMYVGGGVGWNFGSSLFISPNAAVDFYITQRVALKFDYKYFVAGKETMGHCIMFAIKYDW